MAKEIFTRKETADILGIRPKTLWHWERRGWIKPSFHVGNHPRYSISSIEKAITDNQKVKSN